MSINFKKWFCKNLGWFCKKPIPPPPIPPIPPPPLEYVTVLVCKTSGNLPNQYCPATEKCMYLKGDEPKTVCMEHKRPELKKLLFVAAYDLFGATGDKGRFIQAIADSGATGIRIFYRYAWPGNVPSPYKQIAMWKAGYVDAPDIPFYDMDQDNPEYWNVFRAVHRQMKDAELTAHSVLDDFCSLKVGGWQKYLHPVLSSRPDREAADPNVNRLPGGFWGMGDNTLQPYHRRWYERIVRELNDIGVKYYLEPMNEADALDWSEDYFVTWHKWAIDTLIGLGVPKERIIASSGRATKAITDQVGLYSVHGIVRPEKVIDIQDRPHERIVISGDGGFNGMGDIDGKGRRGCSPIEAAGIAQKILQYGYAGYEYLCRGLYYPNNDRADLNRINIEPIKAFISALN